MKKTISVKDLKGIVPKPGKPVSIEDMNRAIAEGGVRRWERFLKSLNPENTNESRSK